LKPTPFPIGRHILDQLGNVRCKVADQARPLFAFAAHPPPKPIGSAMNYDADLVGMATPQQFEDTLAAVQTGPLPPAALERLTTLRQAFAWRTTMIQ
jgi:hypothetical protein